MADGGEQRRFDTKIHTTRNDRKIRLSLVFVASYKLVYHSISFFKDHFNKGRFLIKENFFLDQNLRIKKSKEIATLNIAISLTSTRYLIFKQTRKEEGKKKDTIFDAIMRFLQAIP